MDESKARSERIRELIGIYGADFDRWPATEGLGRPVLDAELQKLRDAEDELDLLIAGAAVPEPSAALRHRILDIPERRVRQNAWNGLCFKRQRSTCGRHADFRRRYPHACGGVGRR